MKPWIKYFLTGLVAFIVGVAAAGGSETTGSSTTTVTETATADAAPAETVTRTVTHRVRVKATPKQAKSYSGNGGKSLGTIEVPNGATLKWTNDGGLMQILTEGPDPVPVNSEGNSGDTELAPGTYPQFQVNADGNWTIRIIDH